MEAQFAAERQRIQSEMERKQDQIDRERREEWKLREAQLQVTSLLQAE